MEAPALLNSIPQNEWIGKIVLIRVGQLAGYSGKVLKYEHGWVTVDHPSLDGGVHSRRPKELSLLPTTDTVEKSNDSDNKEVKDDGMIDTEKEDTMDKNKFHIDYNDLEEMMFYLDSYFEEEGEYEVNTMEEIDEIESESDEVEGSSNLEDISPSKGMRVEIRDKDYIWSAASIFRVNEDITVTVRYDGWGFEWDEIVPYPSPRLAKIFTYTKEVKCAAELFPKRSKGSNAWPCKVQFRMAHPGHTNAMALLRLETNIFVSPYGHNLPLQLQNIMANNGLWLSTKKIKGFSQGVLSTVKYFEEAMNLATEDHFGVLPDGALEQGTLVSEKYRVVKEGGGGTSALEVRPDYLPAKKRKIEQSTTPDTPEPIPPPIEVEEVEDVSELTLDVPPPIIVTNCFPNICCNPTTKQFTVTTLCNGNEVSLGSFPSLTQAQTPSKTSNRFDEAQSISPSKVVYAFETNYEVGNTFHIGKWTRSLLKLNGPEQRLVKNRIGKRKSYKPKKLNEFII